MGESELLGSSLKPWHSYHSFLVCHDQVPFTDTPMFVHRSAVDTHYGSDALLPGSFLYRAVRLGAGVPSVVRPCVDTIWLRGDLECLQHQCLYSFRLVFGDFDRLPHLALVQQVLGGEIREGRNSLFRLSLISSERFWEGTTLVYKMTGT